MAQFQVLRKRSSSSWVRHNDGRSWEEVTADFNKAHSEAYEVMGFVARTCVHISTERYKNGTAKTLVRDAQTAEPRCHARVDTRSQRFVRLVWSLDFSIHHGVRRRLVRSCELETSVLVRTIVPNARAHVDQLGVDAVFRAPFLLLCPFLTFRVVVCDQTLPLIEQSL